MRIFYLYSSLNVKNISFRQNQLTRLFILRYDSEKKLIESIYNVAVDPQNFQKFLDCWESEFTATANKDLVEKSKQMSDAVEDHFFRAYAILDQVEFNGTETPSLKAHVDASNLPTFVVSAAGQVSILNRALQSLLDIDLGQDLSKISLQNDDLAKAQHLLTQLDQLEPHKVLAIVQTAHDEDVEPVIFAISKLYDEKLQQDCLRFCAVHTGWNVEIGKIIQETFGLTHMELDIAEKLVSGKKLSEIADEKNRSILTIRTQSKSLYRKTKLKTQSDLIKFFTLLQNFDHQESSADLTAASSHLMAMSKNNILIREDGRKFYYETYGHPDGEPCLFMHGLMTGTELTRSAIKYLYNHKIKLFAPHRAGFGMSDNHGGDYKIECFTQDILALLDAEKVDEFKILAHSAGSFYAYHLGAELLLRVRKIRVVGGAVPFTSRQQINAFNPRQRVVAYTAKYTPQLLPFLLRGSELQVKKYGAEGLIDALYEDSEFDYELIKDPEIRDIIVSGFEASFQQGVDSVVNDGRYLFSDAWNAMVANYGLPIEIYHGTDNQAVPIAQVEEFVARHNNLSLNVIEGGQLIYYKLFSQVMHGF